MRAFKLIIILKSKLIMTINKLNNSKNNVYDGMHTIIYYLVFNMKIINYFKIIMKKIINLS